MVKTGIWLLEHLPFLTNFLNSILGFLSCILYVWAISPHVESLTWQF